jgi:6-phosphogluconolactonase
MTRPVLAAALALLATSTAAADEWVYFGTYTGGKGEVASKGIYRSKFDPAAGTLTKPELAAEMGNPSFLAAHPTGEYLYAVGEGGGKDGGPVVAFAIDAKTGALTKLNETTSGGSGPCHVRVSPDGGFLGVANYGGGSAAFFAVEKDGKIGKRVAFHTQTGDKDARTHSVAFDSRGAGGYVAACGHDRVKVFTNSEKADFAPHPEREIVLPPGTGPRHIDVLPTGVLAVNGESNSTLNLVLPWLDPKEDKSYRTTLSTLPAGWKGNNSTAEVKVGKPGENFAAFVYVSNRGHDSVAVFEVKGFNRNDPELKAVGHITGDIKEPRNFNIDPSGKWMLIASQNGDKVGVWELDPKTGLGKETGRTVAVGKPVCVTFVTIK